LTDFRELSLLPPQQLPAHIVGIKTEKAASLLEREVWVHALILWSWLSLHYPALGFAEKPTAPRSGCEQILLKTVDRVLQKSDQQEPFSCRPAADLGKKLLGQDHFRLKGWAFPLFG
jgi:hypothetical protein